jgi:hypothetical protein
LCLVALVLVVVGCPPASVLPPGCGKDTDCKGVRICVQHACVDPPQRRRAASPSPSPSPLPPAGVDGGADLVSPAPAADGGVALHWEPTEPSAMFHGGPFHTGRSRFRIPTTAPKEVMHVATGGVVFS